MSNRDLWNICIKYNKCKIIFNSSVFIFLFLTSFFYLKHDENYEFLIFLKSYIVIFLSFIIYKISYNLICKKNSVVYAFGVAQNNPSKILKQKKAKFLSYFCDTIFTITACLYIKFNSFPFHTYSYPLFLFLINIFQQQIFYEKRLSLLKKIIITLIAIKFFLLFNAYTISQEHNLTFSVQFYLSYFKLILQSFFLNIKDVALFVTFFFFMINKKDKNEIRTTIKDCQVKEIMTSKNYLRSLSPTDKVDEIIDDVIKLPQKIFPVLVNEKIVGIVKKEDILLHYKLEIMNDYPLIEEIMNKTTFQVSPDSSIFIAKKIFERAHNSSFCLPVVKDGIFMGLLFYELFLEFISIKKILEKFKANNE